MADETLPPQEVLDKIKKLLAMGARAGTPEEAASFNGKAQEYLTRYNLDVATVERKGGVEGKREDAKVEGGYYVWQRGLWQDVAELNFCLYFGVEQFRKRTKAREVRGRYYPVGSAEYVNQHRLVGRSVNVAATKAMAEYLEQSIERLLRERLGSDTGQIQSEWSTSFREGCVSAICEKIQDRRRHMLSDDKRKKLDADKAFNESNRPTTGMGTGVALLVYVDEETDKNNDFLHGAGWSLEQAALRAQDAAERAAAQKADAEWAAAHPEEAAKREEQRRKEARRYRGGGGRTRYTKDPSAFYSGRDAAKKISLDQQVDRRDEKRIGRDRIIER